MRILAVFGVLALVTGCVSIDTSEIDQRRAEFDVDGDGFFSFIGGGADCDDGNADIHPGVADDTCDGIDNDCDRLVDEDLGDAVVYLYLDADGDGFGDSFHKMASCLAPIDFVDNDTDCDDRDDLSHPGAEELCDGIDNDCDQIVDENGQDELILLYADNDGDGFGDPNFGQLACDAPAGWVENMSDCSDDNINTYPDADESCDGVDNNCNGLIDEDNDGLVVMLFADDDQDGFGDPRSAIIACAAPLNWIEDDTDCDDSHPGVNPDATELCDEFDNNCNGQMNEGDLVETLFYEDVDGDGFGLTLGVTEMACTPSVGFVSRDGDCNDDDDSVSPGAAEVCNGVDNDCNGVIDSDGLGGAPTDDARTCQSAGE